MVRGVTKGLDLRKDDMFPYNENFDYLKFAKDVRDHSMNLRTLSDDSVSDIPRTFILRWLLA